MFGARSSDQYLGFGRRAACVSLPVGSDPSPSSVPRPAPARPSRAPAGGDLCDRDDRSGGRHRGLRHAVGRPRPAEISDRWRWLCARGWTQSWRHSRGAFAARGLRVAPGGRASAVLVDGSTCPLRDGHRPRGRARGRGVARIGGGQGIRPDQRLALVVRQLDAYDPRSIEPDHGRQCCGRRDRWNPLRAARRVGPCADRLVGDRFHDLLLGRLHRKLVRLPEVLRPTDPAGDRVVSRLAGIGANDVWADRMRPAPGRRVRRLLAPGGVRTPHAVYEDALGRGLSGPRQDWLLYFLTCCNVISALGTLQT